MIKRRTKIQLEQELEQAQKRILELEQKPEGQSEMEREALYRVFVEQSQDGIAMFDESGRINLWNPAQEKITGIPQAEAFDHKFWDIQYRLLNPKSRERLTVEYLQTALIDTFKTGKHPHLGKNIQVEIRTAEGKRKFIEITPFSVKMAEGYRIGTITRDITEHKQVEIALRESEARFSKVFSSNPVGINIFRLSDNHSVEANDAFLEIIGYLRNELIGHSAAELNLFVDPEARKKWMMSLRSGQPVRNQDAKIRRKSGEIRDVLASIDLTIIDGEQMGIVIATDITERKQAEEALRESNEIAQAILNASTESVFLMDTHGKVIALNETTAMRLNTSVNAIIGKNIYDFIPAANAEMRRKWVETVVREKKPLLVEDKRSDIWLENSMYPIFDNDGEVRRIAIYGRDITARKQAEAALKESEASFRSIFEDATLGIYRTTPDGRILMSNPALVRMLGFENFKELSQRNLEQDGSNSDYPRSKFREQIEQEGAVIGLESTWRKKDGSPIYVRENAHVLFDENGNVKFYEGTVEDITERKRTEEELIRLNKEKELILTSVGEGILGVDEKGLHTFVNAAAAKMLGYKEAELIGKPSHEIWHYKKPDGSPYPVEECEIVNSYRQGVPHHSSTEVFWRKDGSCFPVEYASTPILNQGKLAGAVITCSDITERKQTENSLRESQARTEMALKGSNSGMWDWNLQTGIPTFSARWSEIIGYTLQELEPITFQTWRELCHPDDLKKSDAILEKHLAGELEYYECEVRMRHKNGTWVWILDRGKVMEWGEDGKPTRMLGTHLDITQRKKAEQALHDSESRASAMLNAIPDLIFRLNRDGVFLDYKADIHDLYAQSELNILGKRNRDLTPKEFADLIDQKIKETLDTGKVQTFEYQLPIIDRGLCNYEARMAASGENEVVAVVHDITEHKQAENLLRQRVAELEMLYETGLSLSQLLSPVEIGRELIKALEQKLDWHHIVIRLYDPDNNTMHVLAFSVGSPEAKEHFTDQTLSSDVGFSGWALKHSQVVRSGDISRDPRYLETFPGMNSGIYVPMKSRRNLIGVISIEKAERDAFTEADERLIVTLANQAAVAIENARLNNDLEERVKQRTAEVQDLYENAPTGYHSLDASGKFLLINQTELNWLGRTHEEMIGHAITEFLTPESIATFRKNFPVFKQQGYLHDLEMDFIRKDGSILPLLINATTILDKNGNFIMSRSTAIDNTEHKAAEETMRRANTEMARAMRMKDEFLASMSHELRTPLTGILGLSEALQMDVYGALNEKQRSTVGTIETSGHHLLELINDILDVSKIEAGKLELQMENCSLGDICQSSIQLTKGMAGSKRQNIDFAIHPANINLHGDPRRLKQVIVNLLSNAVKFTPEGGSLGLEVVLDEDAKNVRVTVWDTGIGIQQEDMQKLFQPFVQLDSSLSRQHGGTGLGLVLVQRLVEMHRGHIEVQSKPGQGSRFNIILPCQPVTRDNTALRKYRCALIIEDNPVNAEQLSRYARALGIIPFTQPESGNALEFAVTLQPDVIFLDVHLADISGWELLTELKAGKATRHIPIIITSGEDDKEKAVALNTDGCLVQFYTIADVRNVLEKIHHPSKGLDQPASSQENTVTVMIVDDNAVNISSLEDYLAAQNFTVVSVKSGVEFLERAPLVMPDIVLMDIQMPGMDGLETTHRLRLLPNRRLASVPVIAVTALAMPGDREHCINAGANEYISKPFHLPEVKELILRLLAENKYMGNA